jgi:hypothetical protein
LLGHSGISRANLRCGLATFDQSNSASNLTCGNPAGPPAKVLPGFSSLADGFRDTFALDAVFHLREGGHDRDQHSPHRRRGLDIASAEIQDSQAGIPLRSPSAKASMFGWIAQTGPRL